jgi:hypothetical protein
VDAAGDRQLRPRPARPAADGGATAAQPGRHRQRRLLEEHIGGAVALLAAAKSGDAARIEAARAAWYDNANRIAAFLNHANPRFWPLREMRAMMRKHLDDTLDEAVARLQGRYDDDIQAYERIHRHILRMADMLSAGIVKQFPQRFRA